MERTPVQSSNLLAIGYEPSTEILEVEFLDNSVYEYRNVPQVVYDQFMNASSLGSYFNREISQNYPYSKIG